MHTVRGGLRLRRTGEVGISKVGFDCTVCCACETHACGRGAVACLSLVVKYLRYPRYTRKSVASLLLQAGYRPHLTPHWARHIGRVLSVGTAEKSQTLVLYAFDIQGGDMTGSFGSHMEQPSGPQAQSGWMASCCVHVQDARPLFSIHPIHVLLAYDIHFPGYDLHSGVVSSFFIPL